MSNARLFLLILVLAAILICVILATDYRLDSLEALHTPTPTATEEVPTA